MITIFIYNKTTLDVIARPIVDSFNNFTLNPNDYYPEYDSEIHIVSLNELVNPVIDNNIIREKTNEELYLEGIYQLKEGEIYNETSGKIEITPRPDNIYKPAWNFNTKEWYETATQEEINTIEFNKKMSLFNSEFNVFKNVHVLHEIGLIELVEYNKAKEYIVSLDPYNPGLSVDRPTIFDKYTTKGGN